MSPERFHYSVHAVSTRNELLDSYSRPVHALRDTQLAAVLRRDGGSTLLRKPFEIICFENGIVTHSNMYTPPVPSILDSMFLFVNDGSTTKQTGLLNLHCFDGLFLRMHTIAQLPYSKSKLMAAPPREPGRRSPTRKLKLFLERLHEATPSMGRNCPDRSTGPTTALEFRALLKNAIHGPMTEPTARSDRC